MCKLKNKHTVLRRNITMRDESINAQQQDIYNDPYEDDRFEAIDSNNASFSEWQNINPDILRISYKSLTKMKRKHLGMLYKSSKRNYDEGKTKDDTDNSNFVKGISIKQVYIKKRNASYLNTTDSKAKIKIQIPLPENFGNQLDKNSEVSSEEEHTLNQIPSRKYEELTPFEQALSKKEMK